MASFFSLFLIVFLLGITSPAVSGRCTDVQSSTTEYVPVDNALVEVVTKTCSLGNLVALDVASPVDVSGEPCSITCSRNGTDLPPIDEDCDKIKAAVGILSGKGSIRNTFTLGPGESKTLSCRTCVYFFRNTADTPMKSSWEDIDIDASLARSACYPPTMPMNSVGNCTAIDKTWVVG
ncbi:hypothetical protein ARMSODRAFT_796978 [Armillaria solidipes]|uniref:Uncharacterized protein n=1 Tax=Armillaria solidipes TaxID=1076256 RepID=A0A2H3BSQ3_9AGAR|nr:hypothetical protein ARMSODRAFT_796978 [Armillaria solidipes]